MSGRIPTTSTLVCRQTRTRSGRTLLPAQYWNHTDTRNAALATEKQQKRPEPVLHRQSHRVARVESGAVQPACRAGAVHQPDHSEEPVVAPVSPHERRDQRPPGPGAATGQSPDARCRSGVPAPVFAGSQSQRGVLGNPRRGVAQRHQRVRRSADAMDHEPECAAASRHAERRLRAAVRPRPAVLLERRRAGHDSGRMADGPDVRMAAGCAVAVRKRVLLRRRRRHRDRAIRRSISGSTSRLDSSAARRACLQISRSGCSRCGSMGFAATRRCC